MHSSIMETTKEYLGKLISPKQIRALLWKDLLVRLRQPWMTTLQFVWPVFLFISLYLLRMRFSSAEIDACQFPTRQLPNKADVLPFFQSYICTIDNQCIDPAIYEETSAFTDAPVSPILNIVQTFLNEPLLFDALTTLPETANFLGAVTTVATHPRFKYLEQQIGIIQQRIPEYEGKVGTNFDILKVWSDQDTFAKFGNILCGKPFPKGENIRLVEKAFYHEDYNGPDKDELDIMPTPYCKQLYLDVTNSNRGKITWNQVKPIIQGKIIYGPDSPETRQIMSYANGTFEGILRLKTFLISLDTIVTKLRTEEDFREQLVKLIDLVKTPIIQSIIGVMAIDTKAIDSIFDALLHDESIPAVLTTVSSILGCFNVDRFHVVKDAAEMEAMAIEMNNKKLFYAGIFFDGDGNYTDKRNVSYTIRMDIDNTPKTIENRNRFYFPGPEASFAEDMRYHKGFIEWQHAVDTGIIKLFKDEKVQRLALEKGGQTSTEKDEELSLDDDFFKDSDEGSLPIATTTERTSTEDVPSFEIEDETANSKPFDPDVESFLEFEDEGDRGNRTKRQFSGLLDSLFNTNDDSSEEDGETKFELDQLQVFTKMFPYPKYVQDDFKKGLYMANAVQVAFFFALLVQIAAAVRHRLWMKESGNRRLMQAMGLYQSSDPISWAITTMIEIAITFLLCCSVLYVGGVLVTSSKLYIAFLLMLFGISVLAFCFMTTSFFTTASIGSVSSAIIFLATFMPYVVIVSVGTSLTWSFKFILNLSVSTAFCFAWHQIMRMELQQIPLTFENAFEGTMETNDLKFGMFMLVLDTILYSLAGYLYARFSTDEYQFFEVAVKDMDASIGAELTNVTKTYDGAAKPSLNRVSMTFRRDQITCLLGRNGAGKSTIIKLLTGQIQATEGKVCLPQNVDRITGDEHKERVGLCPQGTVLIPNLTAKEHLQMYAQIKMERGEAGEVERVMDGLDFGIHENFASENLSGGFKRRLNIGIAFIGSPNLVILDEPCSAIDTKTRKTIWETIKVLRKGRAVIMATHYLDEAEHLSDSVLIMNEGHVIGQNSPASLKEQFTKSFNIKIELIDSPLQRSTIEDIRRRFAELTPSHSIEDMQANVFDINVAYHSPDQKYFNFGPLIRYLEELHRTKLIVGFKVHSNDLEGIFNGLIQSHEVCNDGVSVEVNGRSDTFNGTNKTITYYKELSMLTVIASLFWKRFKHFRRNFRLIVCVLVLPTIFVALAMAFMTIRPPGEFDIALPMSPQLYPDSEEFYSLERSNSFDDQVFAALTNNDSLTFNTSESVFRWLLVGEGQNGCSRYGGISLNGTTAAVWYNNKGYHSMPSYLNQLNNALFNVEMNASAGEEFHIRTVNHPIKLGKDELSASSVLQKIADAGISIILLVAFSLVIAGSSIYIVNERISGEKLQQRLAGVKFHTYWGVCFVWDMAVYGLAMALAVIVFVWFDIPAYTAKDNLAGICMLLGMYGFATIPMVHLFEKMFNDASLANMHILCLNIIVGLATRTTIILIELLGESETSDTVRNFLNRMFLVLPQHALADGLVEVCQNHILAVVFERYYINTYKSPLTSNLLVPHLASLFVFGVVFAIINYTIESGITHRFWHRIHRLIKGERKEFLNIVPLSDTSAHRLAADSEKNHPNHANDYVVRVDNIYKTYGNGHMALGGVSFHVNRGECFGLLGANGAGKSTIFGILSGQIYQTSGTVQWFDRKGVSYCPQSNALDMLLTVAETIHFYGTLRKIADINRLTARTLRQFHLGQYADVLVKNLSGGNRRKLIVACTCFGDTSLVLMDEPTSDMDPITRTMTYSCIRSLLLDRRSVILTSHTITEIDRVCDRIGVLRRGQMLSTGAPAALQTMYGISYMVTVFYDQGTDAGKLERDLGIAFPGLEALVVHNYCVQFTIRILPVADELINGSVDRDHSKEISLSALFDQMHAFTSDRSMVFTITECLLDQAFERILESTSSTNGFSFSNSAFVLNETIT